MKQLSNLSLIIMAFMVLACKDKRVIEPTDAPLHDPHYVGESFEGGTIIYADAKGQHGLIVADNDFSGAVASSLAIAESPASSAVIVNMATIYASGVSGIASFNLSKVKININHGYDSDLEIYLQAPNGVSIILTSNNGGSSDNYTNTYFSTGYAPITSGSAPFTGTYSPEQPFSNFASSSCNGGWNLIAIDHSSGITGTLLGWSLTFSTGETFSWPIIPPGPGWWNGVNITTGATATGIYAGSQNTNLIVANQGTGNYAASMCDTVYQGHSDWYLPSKDELNLIYLNRSHFTNFTFPFYWSSTEETSSTAFCQDLSAGFQAAIPKSTTNGGVRAVRKF